MISLKYEMLVGSLFQKTPRIYVTTAPKRNESDSVEFSADLKSLGTKLVKMHYAKDSEAVEYFGKLESLKTEYKAPNVIKTFKQTEAVEYFGKLESLKTSPVKTHYEHFTHQNLFNIGGKDAVNEISVEYSAKLESLKTFSFMTRIKVSTRSPQDNENGEFVAKLESLKTELMV